MRPFNIESQPLGLALGEFSGRSNLQVFYASEGINLFDEPKKQYISILQSQVELNNDGPGFFIGIRCKN